MSIEDVDAQGIAEAEEEIRFERRQSEFEIRTYIHNLVGRILAEKPDWNQISYLAGRLAGEADNRAGMPNPED